MDTLQLSLKQQSIQEAAARFEYERSALHRSDGTPKFSPAEEEERTSAALEPLRVAVQEAIDTAEAAEQEAVTLELHQHADPIAALPPVDMTKAESLRPFIVDYCANESLSDLLNRLAYIQAHGSKAEKVLYSIYAQRRHSSTMAAVRGGRVNADTESLSKIGRMLEELKIAIVPQSVADALEKATTLRSRATELRNTARDTLAQHDGTRQRQQAAVDRRYKEIF